MTGGKGRSREGERVRHHLIFTQVLFWYGTGAWVSLSGSYGCRLKTIPVRSLETLGAISSPRVLI
jgi:hypothetical protein